MYHVRLAPTAAQALRDLHPELRRQLKAALLELAENPYAGKILQNELVGFLSCKVKRYRIIYSLDRENGILKVFMIGHRVDVYELFSQLLPQK